MPEVRGERSRFEHFKFSKSRAPKETAELLEKKDGNDLLYTVTAIPVEV